MARIDPQDVDRVMQHLSPQARVALRTLSEMQNRPAEDVLRDEIREYIAGRLPAIDIDFAMQQIQKTAWQAGFIIGKLRRYAKEFGDGE